MNNSDLDRNLDIEELAEYIATASQTIVNEMKKQGENHLDFNEAVQAMKNESLIEQQKCQEDFNARRSRIKRKFNRRR
ncbi:MULTISPECIES: hypothetical protein [Nostocales]|jgi:hypothetical protein|uniref:hypothetical protein n=1 Tax=Nostocales TaxID=1161 RepID=UPI00059B573A|nr:MULTISPECIES: hypothetical protein [Nostocales]MBO1052172.1 hypothetical protein [Dolichospermum sp. DET73]MTJ16598.1 hypothetical protein [Dolichospermum sp. UHCC 0299]MTJ23645.1 hypothetical protein [Dolichospermum sp. UHCC 0352]MTJ40196.1 hypothetical protein [Dolichospermum sp. UHCC 0406]